MKLLLDTHILLWGLSAPDRLSVSTRERIQDTGNALYFSVASIWELALKKSHHPGFAAEPRQVRVELWRLGFSELNIAGAHAILSASLPDLHKDPFDRILLAQAMVEGLMLLTADAVLARYPGPVELV